MISNELLKELGINEEDIEKEVSQIIGTTDEAAMAKLYDESIKDFEVDTILKGKILNIVGKDVIIDIGYKSEGVVPLSEFSSSDEVKIGTEIEVLLEAVEGESGLICLSKVKADRIRGWERIIATHKEGDLVRGRVIRKTKGGLVVDISVPVFLPASQVDIRKAEDIGMFVGKEIEALIIKIDEKKMNIIISRRKLLEIQREEMKKKLIGDIQDGDVRRGVVKNIADFGVFVDLGGIDGLLHITDMSWGRISHPSEMVAIDQPIDVKILKVEKEKEKIALGLKQLTENPWNNIDQKFPMDSKVKGKVVNILPYGAFVELEKGVEGLVHISEMSWTKRINHPQEMLAIGDTVEAMVLNINKKDQEISLGLKQLETNPWQLLVEKYPIGSKVHGRVRNLTSYGAFVEIEEGIEGLLHVSDISWTKKILHPNECLKKGDKIEATILSIDPDKKRISLGRKQLEPNPWITTFPEKYKVGTVLQSTVTKVKNFGGFVEVEPDLEAHLALTKTPSEQQKPALNPGDVVQVEVTQFDSLERKIVLKLLAVIESKAPAPAETAPVQPVAEQAPTAPAVETPAPEQPPAPPAQA
ncbi:MAG: 30S ribosomal protein S1 [Planctomycetes bacterium]|nr:30S ribosomal protein S1 [Planctomycetota bacterium]